MSGCVAALSTTLDGLQSKCQSETNHCVSFQAGSTEMRVHFSGVAPQPGCDASSAAWQCTFPFALSSPWLGLRDRSIFTVFFLFFFFFLLASAYSKHKLQSHHTLMAVCGAGAHSVSVLLSASGTRFISNGHIAAFAAYTADRRLSISFTLTPPPPALPSPVPPTSWAVQRHASARISLLLYCLFRMHMTG